MRSDAWFQMIRKKKEVTVQVEPIKKAVSKDFFGRAFE